PRPSASGRIRPALARLHGRFDEPLFVEDCMERNSGGNPNLAYAIRLVHAVCCLAGSASYLDDIRADLGISRAVKDHDTPALFDWLIEVLSFQGISDAVAAGYMAQHGSVRWGGHCRSVVAKPFVPKARRVLAVLRLPVPQGDPDVFR